MNKIREVLFKNLGFKILSLLFAVILWYVGLNIVNPPLIQTFTVPLTIVNKESITTNGFVLLNEKELTQATVDVRIRASRSEIQALSRASRGVIAKIDLKPIEISLSPALGEPMPATVQIDAGLTSYDLINIYPNHVNVYLDKLIEKSFDIELDITGSFAEGYLNLQPYEPLPQVTLKGAMSVIDNVSKVCINIDAAGASSNIVQNYPISIVSKDGRDIKNLITTDISNVDLILPVYYKSTVPVNVTTSGASALGYRVSRVQVYPEKVDICGPKYIVENITGIDLPPVSVQDATTDISESFVLADYLATEGIYLVDDKLTDARVSVTVEKEDLLEISISMSNVIKTNIPQNTILPASVDVRLWGLKRDFDEIDTKSILAAIDLSGLRPGTNKVPVRVILPDNLTKYNLRREDVFIQVKIPDSIQ